jgi:serine/threonine protein kinase
MIGETLNHFKILDRLGKGGMGEVYVAEDGKLKRRVALKVLPEEVARDPARLDRFQREAESIAALNHPNIVTIYSIEEADGIRFLTMELVQGETLIQLIPSNGLDVESFVRFSAPVAQALSAAHEKGIVHRDLKPGNIMVSHEGRIKVLDFGLAKLIRDDSDPDSSRMETYAQTDDRLGEAHNSLAIIKMYFDWDYAGAEQEFKLAIALNPGSALIHLWYGWYLGLMGRFDESFKEMQGAQELDPLPAANNSGIGIVFHPR